MIASLSSALGESKSRLPYAIKELHIPPPGWIKINRAPANHELHLHIGLNHNGFAKLEEHLMKSSDPFHTRYGQHLSADEVNSLIAPSDETISRVSEWLAQNDIGPERVRYSAARDWLMIPSILVSDAESLLNTSYHLFQKGDANVIRATEWSLPPEMHELIDTIQPTTSFFQAHKYGRRSVQEPRASAYQPPWPPSSLNDAAEDLSEGAAIFEGIDVANPPVDLTPDQACNTSAVTPLCLRTLYGTLGYTARATDKNKMALNNFLGEFNNRSDIKRYLRLYRPEASAGADVFEAVDLAGAVNQQTPATQLQLDQKDGREGDLDAQVMLGIGYPTPLVAYSTAGHLLQYNPDDEALADNTNEPFLTWLQYVLAQPDLPSVISTSYAAPEYIIPPSYAKRLCQGFAQLGARGVSVIFGAGDWGVGKPAQCHSKDGRSQFVPVFPESCPYGTSVAATRGINPEVVAFNERNGFVSGGGFSQYFARPDYQSSVVESYLSRLGPLHEGLYNRAGRAYPDVAAMGYRIVTIWNGTTKVVDGTSASAPIFAAVIALLNDALLAEGKPTLGFLNPWLYSVGFKGFVDVTEGSTKGCGTSGFPAMTGWDVASGFGTPVS